MRLGIPFSLAAVAISTAPPWFHDHFRKRKRCSIESTYIDPFRRATELVVQYKEKNACPGISVCVSVAGKPVYCEGFGFADVEQLVPVREDTVFRIASISKSFTSLLVGRLIDQNKLTLDDDVRTYVPEFPEKFIDGKYAKITIKSILNHTSGIRSYHKVSDVKGQEAYPEMMLNKRFDSPLEACSLFQDDPLVHSPGQKYLYSTFAYSLLSAAIERVCTQKGPLFPSSVQPSQCEKNGLTKTPKWARIDTQFYKLFQFLGLSRTSLEFHEEMLPFRARQYRRTNASVLENTPTVDNSHKWAGGGIVSTAPDLVRLANHLAEIYMGRLQSGGLISRATLNTLWTACPINPDAVWQPGVGWFLSRRSGGCITDTNICPDRLYVLHTGGAVGCTTALLLSLPCFPSTDSAGSEHPDHQNAKDFNAAVSKAPPVCVAVLTNLEDSSKISQLAVALAELFTEAAVQSQF